MNVVGAGEISGIRAMNVVDAGEFFLVFEPCMWWVLERFLV